MTVYRHGDISKDLRRLRKFSAAEESLLAWERLFELKALSETPGIERMPGFGDRKIYKARVVPLKENVGKSKGYRAIFEIFDDGIECRILVLSRHGIYHSEGDLVKLIHERLNTPKI